MEDRAAYEAHLQKQYQIMFPGEKIHPDLIGVIGICEKQNPPEDDKKLIAKVLEERYYK